MKKLALICLICGMSAACTTQRYVVTEGTYSAWKGDEMHLRKKTILVDTETGDTWGLAYDKENKKYTRDGYGWQKLPVEDLVSERQ